MGWKKEVLGIRDIKKDKKGKDIMMDFCNLVEFRRLQFSSKTGSWNQIPQPRP